MKNLSANTFFLLTLIIYLSITFLIISVSDSAAQTMSNTNYILQMGNLNSFAGKPTGSGYKLGFTGGQTGANLFSGANYKVRAGFQYIKSIISFRFAISSTFIDFGIISPTTPVSRTNNLTISNGSAHGYQITVSQNHNLRVNASGFEIPPTTCDGGSCNTTTAAAWTSSLVYGFGYRCDNVSGTDCDTGFSTSTFYKQFASSPSAIAVMSSNNVSRNRQSQITYKVNIPGTQPAGLYTNILNYIAIPTF